MADEQDEQLETSAVEEESPSSVRIVDGKKYTATLVNGENFFYGNIRFQQGVPRVVTADVARHLATKVIKQSLQAADETAQPFNRKRFRISAASPVAVATKPAPVRSRRRVAE